jgi:hypothetical protein
MGSDFLQRVGNTLKRSWDQGQLGSRAGGDGHAGSDDAGAGVWRTRRAGRYRQRNVSTTLIHPGSEFKPC